MTYWPFGCRPPRAAVGSHRTPTLDRGAAQPAARDLPLGVGRLPDVHGLEVGALGVGVADALDDGQLPLLPQRLEALHAGVQADVVVEAEELVEDGFITESDFKEFMFWNPAELHAGMNPDFFKGTRVEKDVDAFLKSGRL